MGRGWPGEAVMDGIRVLGTERLAEKGIDTVMGEEANGILRALCLLSEAIQQKRRPEP